MNRVNFTLNGRAIQAEVEPRTSLAEFLRNDQCLTATHLGCEHGVCGACTVVVDGAPVRSCILFAASLDGAEVRTLEGYRNDPLMSRVRDAFHVEHALQCGFCTPGMLIMARDIVSRFDQASEQRIRRELAGNLCRCTGYMGIVNAVQRVMNETPAEQRMSATVFDDNVVSVKRVSANAKAAAEPAPEDEGGQQSERPLAPGGFPPSTEQKGWNRVQDEFVVGLPSTEVWALFEQNAAMARCLPGFELISEAGNDIKGNMQVAFGPIKANFACVASIERDAASMRGVLRGSGQDPKGGSRAKGTVGYQLVDEVPEKSTRVLITLDYQLQGRLAQFGRSGLVRDFSSRLIAAFARNLAASLTGAEPPAATGSMPLGQMLWSVLTDRIKRLFGRRDSH